MNNKYVSSIHFTDEQSLREYYDLCGLSPAITFESTKAFDYKKTTYLVGDLFICSTKSDSGWGFEKQISTDVFFLSYTYSGNSRWEMNRIGRLDVANKLCVIDSSELVQGQFASGTATDTLMIDASIIHRELAASLGFPPEGRLQFEPILSADSRAWGVISSIASTIGKTIGIDNVLSSPISVSYLKQALLSAVLETVPNNFSTVPDYKISNLPAYILRAKEYMHENASLPITLADIAENSYTSIRNLQFGFRKHYDTTPMRYLRILRLAKVRSDLLSIDVNLPWCSVSKKWGFSDTQAFSRYYRAIYNETPFQTSRRAKGIIK